MIQVKRKGRMPFRMCIDTKCETKAEWGKPSKIVAAKVKAIEKSKAVALKADKIPKVVATKQLSKL